MNARNRANQKLAEVTSILAVLGALSLYFLVSNCENKSTGDCIKEEPHLFSLTSFGSIYVVVKGVKKIAKCRRQQLTADVV